MILGMGLEPIIQWLAVCLLFWIFSFLALSLGEWLIKSKVLVVCGAARRVWDFLKHRSPQRTRATASEEASRFLWLKATVEQALCCAAFEHIWRPKLLILAFLCVEQLESIAHVCQNDSLASRRSSVFISNPNMLFVMFPTPPIVCDPQDVIETN